MGPSEKEVDWFIRAALNLQGCYAVIDDYGVLGIQPLAFPFRACLERFCQKNQRFIVLAEPPNLSSAGYTPLGHER